MSDKETGPNVTVHNMPGAQQAVIDTSATSAPSDPDAPLVSPTGPTMPEGGSEKFWDAEKGIYNWEADAKEKAWQLSQRSGQTAGQGEAAEGAEGAEESAGDEADQQAAEQAGVDLNAFNTYVAENGEPSEEHLALFEKAGISREIVEDYVSMKLDMAETHVRTVQEYLGGETGLALLRDHLAKNFSDAEVAAFEQQLYDPGTWRTTAAFLLQSAGLPQSGKGLVKGPNAAASATSGERFNSEAEFNAAMRDPRYRSDPAFRARVQAAVRNSPNLMSTGGAQHTL